ncbi:MAG: hypothetical protein JGK17_31330 [Microcoleus sp. PH2017_10_PVI_O_A]|uniref:hypothetical protein n=1 Tax=unclassified Microcoleus TaxID=2642155 RepID=UPI001D539182|nr:MULTISPECIES: hypothetical protein [unclassified Microcoleus]TAE73536.1 MAG: hypothetical protein EAZ83_31365 [Oscillatoriales cyanobacterium]MCC3409949.1 hypothetical protein [Microcoleus sp. PH2017_10_PVI_O_A]MCC3464197.1 hypothetical protein [Microcoleus sp. PH2017_11_PCY_U_A]MCC3482540.1 hypothetical protein [Microcoleus sp. PH2017_12_PCY_D_A]MCC3532101.1 hypothetical protein [Microcoleus sp. PH2017_21_RUC_O_A]
MSIADRARSFGATGIKRYGLKLSRFSQYNRRALIDAIIGRTLGLYALNTKTAIAIALEFAFSTMFRDTA